MLSVHLFRIMAALGTAYWKDLISILSFGRFVFNACCRHAQHTQRTHTHTENTHTHREREHTRTHTQRKHTHTENTHTHRTPTHTERTHSTHITHTERTHRTHTTHTEREHTHTHTTHMHTRTHTDNERVQVRVQQLALLKLAPWPYALTSKGPSTQGDSVAILGLALALPPARAPLGGPWFKGRHSVASPWLPAPWGCQLFPQGDSAHTHTHTHTEHTQTHTHTQMRLACLKQNHLWSEPLHSKKHDIPKGR